MEFFDLFNFVNAFTEVIHGGFSFRDLWISLGVGAGLYLVCLIFGGLGMYVMASRRNMKHAWLGFLPFLNTYYAGKIAGEANFFGQKMKRHGLYAMLAEILYVGISIFAIVTSVFLMNPNFWETTVTTSGETVTKFVAENVPAQFQWIIAANDCAGILSSLIFIVMIIFMCVVYNAVYRKYYMRGPFIMTILSTILPFRGIVMFCVRKNTPVDYNEVMRKRMEAMYRAHNVEAPPSTPNAPSPFDEFGEKRPTERSPFSEFDGTPPEDRKDE